MALTDFFKPKIALVSIALFMSVTGFGLGEIKNSVFWNTPETSKKPHYSGIEKIAKPKTDGTLITNRILTDTIIKHLPIGFDIFIDVDTRIQRYMSDIIDISGVENSIISIEFYNCHASSGAYYLFHYWVNGEKITPNEAQYFDGNNCGENIFVEGINGDELQIELEVYLPSGYFEIKSVKFDYRLQKALSKYKLYYSTSIWADGSLFVTNADRSNTTQILSPNEPSIFDISPDEKYITGTGIVGFFIAESMGTNFKQFRRESRYPVVSAKHQIAYLERSLLANPEPDEIDTYDFMNLFVTEGPADLPRINITNFTESYTFGGHTWSPDGNKLAYSCNKNGNFDIFISDRFGNEIIDITVEGDNYNPAWSPDQSKIAFLRNHAYGKSLWMMNDDGSNCEMLTNEQKNILSYGWSPNSKEIIYIRTEGSDNVICKINTISKNEILLTEVPADYRNAIWSPDGEKVFYNLFESNGVNNIWVIDSNGLNKTNITKGFRNLFYGTDDDSHWLIDIFMDKSYTTDTIPWLEDFNCHADGTAKDEGTTSWTSKRDQGISQVEDGKFIVSSAGSEAYWKSGEIDISSVDAVDIYLTIKSSGPLNGTYKQDDFLEVSYIVDGNENQIVYKKSDFNNNHAEQISKLGITGNVLQLVIKTRTSGANDSYSWDNIQIIAGDSKNKEDYKILYSVDRQWDDELFICNSDGSNQRNITNHPADYGLMDEPVGTPVFLKGKNKVLFNDGSQASSPLSSINISSLDKNILLPKFVDFNPTQDGNKLLYSLVENDLWLANIDGSNAINITNTPDERENYAGISANNQEVIYTHNSSSGYDLYKINVDGTNKVKLTNDPNWSVEYGIWSPDGEKILFMRGIWEQLCVMDKNGENIVVLDSSIHFHSRFPWSHDSQKIVYVTSKNGNHQICTINSDGTDKKVLVNAAGRNPLWSPKSNQILYVLDKRIWKIDADGSNNVPLNNNSNNDETYVLDVEPDFLTNGVFVDPRDNQEYKWVKIGEQVWMGENLRATSFADGTPIQEVTGNSNWGALTASDAAYCWFADDSITYAETYGALYTWAAAMNRSTSKTKSIQGACPTGWHLPSDSEWKELEMYLGMSQTEADNIGWRGTNEGTKLAGNAELWNNGDLKNNAEFGTSGFTALPGNSRHYLGEFFGIGTAALWWSSTEHSSRNAMSRYIYGILSSIYRPASDKKNGFSIRCLKDIGVNTEMIWLENFKGLPNGLTEDNGNTAWSLENTNGDCYVRNEQFLFKEPGQQRVWKSEYIDISSVPYVNITVDVYSAWNLENNDNISILYKINNGPEKPIESKEGRVRKTISGLGFTGDSIQIIVKARVDEEKEFYYIDNISVTTGLLLLSDKKQQTKSSVSKTKEVESDNSFKNTENYELIKLYPNPTQGRLNINSGNSVIEKIEVYSYTGQLLKSFNDVNNVININDLLPGLYIIKMHLSNNEISIHNIEKQ